MQIDEITTLSGLSDAETLKTLYVLWLGGFLSRQYWNVALNAHILSSMSSATYELKKEAAPLPVIKPIEQKQNVPEVKQEIKETVSKKLNVVKEKVELTLEKYLENIEAAETHYELLNIPYESSVSEIKMAYFGLAKRFHPDLFHKKTDDKTHRRIQNAFSEIARASETLRDKETRETYDFKLRKILRELDKLSPEEKAKPKTEQKELSEASDIFEHGFNLLMEEEYEQALPYLLRAAHIAPDVARYRAYYGKTLSIDKNQRYNAEAELQAAIKLESDNPGYRIMLAEFFIQYNLPKRAEGELTRLLTILPDNKEAQALLDSLQNK